MTAADTDRSLQLVLEKGGHGISGQQQGGSGRTIAVTHRRQVRFDWTTQA